MYGTLLSADEENDEYIVLIRLFGRDESKVYFRKDEIKLLDEM